MDKWVGGGSQHMPKNYSVQELRKTTIQQLRLQGLWILKSKGTEDLVKKNLIQRQTLGGTESHEGSKFKLPQPL